MIAKSMIQVRSVLHQWTWFVLFVGFFPSVYARDERLALGSIEGKTWAISTDSSLSISNSKLTFRVTDDEETKEATPNSGWTVSQRLKAELADTIVKQRIRPLEVHRHYQSIDLEVEVPDELRGSLPPSMEAVSPLEGTTVVFRWDAEAGEYSKSYLPGHGAEKGDALLGQLREDVTFRAFLPENEVKIGARWKVALTELDEILAPGGLYFGGPEFGVTGERPDSLASGLSLNSPFAAALLQAAALFEVPSGVLEVEYLDLKTTDEGVRVAVLTVTADVAATVDPSSAFRSAVETGVPTTVSYEYSHEVTSKLEGKGRLVWNLDLGCLVDFEFQADVEVSEDIDMSARFEHPTTGEPKTVGVEITASWNGSLHSHVSAREVRQDSEK